MKSVAIISVLLLFASYRPHKTHRASTSSAHNSVLTIPDSARTCLSIGNSSLAPAAEFRLIMMSSNQFDLDAQGMRPNATCLPFATRGRFGVADPSLYRLRGADLDFERFIPAFAVADFSRSFQPRGNLLATDSDGDEINESSSWCTSSERIHYTIWSGNPREGRPRWRGHYSLGYDARPACEPAEMRAMPVRVTFQPNLRAQ